MGKGDKVLSMLGLTAIALLIVGFVALNMAHAQTDMAAGVWHYDHPVEHGSNATTPEDNRMYAVSGTCLFTNYTISKGGTEIVTLLPSGEHQPVSYILSSHSILEVEGKEDPVAFYDLIGSKCTVTVTYRIMVVHDFPVREIIRINLAA